ncbi:G-type lectin S-receptor-like serine/threonine-protein kinase SD2-5 [Triticum dicoccoides]|nr:G-type lectin S-receptor-like serine/threonine-protein kinase SD2-5 [Triticum dicoccoides]
MGPAVLFFLVLAAAAPLLSAVKALDYHSMAKRSTIWINSDDFFDNRNYSRNILSIAQLQAHSDFELYVAAGFYCVSSMFPCDKFVFAISIGDFTNTMVGIYNRQIVWFANRARPVRENATLEFTADGNLVLRDADGTHVWSTNISGRGVDGMKITETGNLFLFDQKNSTVWQSFDYPTDTILAGQSLVEGTRLTTNTSATNMYITVQQDGLFAYAESTPPQLYFQYNMQIPIAKIGNYPTKATLMNGSLSFIFGQEFLNESITLPVAQSTLHYMRLDSDGHLRLYEWSRSAESWTMVYDILGSMGMDACDYPTVCGEYGVCRGGQCACPLEKNSSSSYFKLVDEHKPHLGCTPLTPVSCQEIQHHQLLTIPNIYYNDQNYTNFHAVTYNETTMDACKETCLKNCSCMAVLCTGLKCVWVTKIFSLHSIQPQNAGYNSSAYLKVQLSPSNGNREKAHLSPSNENKKKVIFGATLGVVTTLVLLVIVVVIYLRRRRKYEEKDVEFDFDQLPGMPTRFSFEMLRECTEGFSRKLGEGGFGSVFEGKLGEVRVAVKRLEGSTQGKKEFLAEVKTIGTIEHINLVKLIGFCAEKSERLLVYEYVSRGSLDRWIYYEHENNPLEWCTRRRIILDIAKGLCYLHEDCRRKIAHLDIKPQNILLDDNFNAKVADFGLCKLINRDQSKVVTVMRGTPGYLAPEWLTSPITEKVDVYSFGVVIMEIISGRKNIDDSQPEDSVHLINLLREKEQTNQLIDLIDKHSDEMVSHEEEIIRMMKLAVWCLQSDCARRPSMSTVIKVLEGAERIETFDANSIMFVQDNPSTYSAPSRASILSGPR